MSGTSSHTFGSPIRHDILVARDLEALFAECRERADRAHQGVEQDMNRAALFGDVEPHPVSAYALVGANFSNGIFDRIAEIFERLANNLAHFRIPPTKSLLMLWNAFARIAAAMCLFGGDLQTSCKRNLTPRWFYGGAQPPRSIWGNP